MNESREISLTLPPRLRAIANQIAQRRGESLEEYILSHLNAAVAVDFHRTVEGPPAVPEAPTDEATKSDRGALLFWEALQSIRSQYQQMDQAWLKVTRVLGEFKRRLDCLEETVKVHREILCKDEAAVHFVCIACDTGFELPLAEAVEQDFTTVCPSCGNWALAFPRDGEYNTEQVAARLGVSAKTVTNTIRELGWARGSGHHNRLSEEQVEQIAAARRAKKARAPGKDSAEQPKSDQG
jgi:hypothetical protein